MLPLLLGALLALPGYSLVVNLHPFETDGDPASDSLSRDICESMAKKFEEKNIRVSFRAKGVAPGISTDEISFLYGRIEKTGETILATVTLEMGAARQRFEKSLAQAPGEPLEDFVETLFRKIFTVAGERAFGDLKITADPEDCRLTLNGKSLGITPYEAPFPVGPLELALEKKGYLSLQQTVRVVPGNNRFAFQLSREAPVLPGALFRTWYVYGFAAGWGGVAFAFYSHAAYRTNYVRYLNVRSAAQEEYDRYYHAAQNNLVLRDFSLALSTGLLGICGYKLYRMLYPRQSEVK